MPRRRARRTVRRTSLSKNPAALYVYVVELDPKAARKLHRHPNGSPVLYIGQSGIDPRQRFDQHQRGGMYASDIVRRFGRRLIPELTSGPYPDRPAAERAERETARRLSRQGWIVAGGH